MSREFFCHPSASSVGFKLQAPVYNIPPPAAAIVDYAIGLGKLSANEQFFNVTEMALSL